MYNILSDRFLEQHTAAPLPWLEIDPVMTIIQNGDSLIQITLQDAAQLEQGRLGSTQHQRLHQQRLVFILGTISLIVLVLLLLAMLLTHYWRPSLIPGSVFVAVFAIGLVWLFLLRGAPRQWWCINHDLRAGKVAHADGQVQCSFRQTFGLFPFLKYSLLLGQQRWPVSREVFEQFTNRGRYRIFYAPISGLFLGALALPLPAPDSQPRQNTQTTAIDQLGERLLTPQELEILRLIASGRSNKEIAHSLSLSVNTIKMYASQIYSKLGVQRRTEAVAQARRIGLL